MKRASAVTFVFLATTLFISSGDACPGVPSMTWEDACLKSRDRQEPRWYQLCRDTLRSGPSAAQQVTVFALTATRKALLRYDATMAEIDRMLRRSSVAKPPPALERCKGRYGEARGLVARITEQLAHCDFAAAKQEYYDAHLAVQACLSGLWSGYRGSPLHAAVSADLDLTMVAFELGALLVDGKQ